MSQTGRIDYLVMRTSHEELLEPPPADSTALFAQILSRLGRAFSGIDHLFEENARRTAEARVTFEEQMCKLAAELAEEARRIDRALPPPQQRFGEDDIWSEIGRVALNEQFVKAALIGPILNESIRRFTSYATNNRAGMESGAATYRDELVWLAAQLLDAVSRIPVPDGAE
jgi:hypothetical protein